MTKGSSCVGWWAFHDLTSDPNYPGVGRFCRRCSFGPELAIMAGPCPGTDQEQADRAAREAQPALDLT